MSGFASLAISLLLFILVSQAENIYQRIDNIAIKARQSAYVHPVQSFDNKMAVENSGSSGGVYTHTGQHLVSFQRQRMYDKVAELEGLGPITAAGFFDIRLE